MATAKRPTIADVARRAGVSEGAVSFAVNDRPGVSPETRARILKAADELGWRPSARARALTQARSEAVGLVMARSVERLDADDFFTRFLVGLERALSRRDHALLLRVVGDGDPEAELDAYRRLARDGRVDGVILTDMRRADSRLALLADAGLAAVVAGRGGSAGGFPEVETEHADGVRAATEHLIALGHRRIGFVGGDPTLEHIGAREAAWRATLTAAGLAPGPVANAGADDAAGLAATAAVLDADPRPTAVLATADHMAAAALGVARARGLVVPGDLSVVGFDDFPLAAHCSPPLTTVRVDYARFGETAAETLLAVIGGLAPPAFAPLRADLVVRESTAPP